MASCGSHKSPHVGCSPQVCGVCLLPRILLSNLNIFTSQNCRAQLLKLSVPLVKHHGFSRTALARSALDLPEPHAEPLSDSAVTTLFGEGDTARRTLIGAWLDEGRAHMRSVPVDGVKGALLARLEYNAPVLGFLPEVSLADSKRSWGNVGVLTEGRAHRHSRLFCLRDSVSRLLTRFPRFSTRQASRTRHVK